MSKTVDERVVSMQFDNRHFEKNVSTTMSTLDKLKQKLNFGGVSKSFDKINASAKSCNLSPLSQGIETVQAKFSALQVMGVTALANITNSAVNAGKRMVSALTIDPIKTGLSEYETKINAIQVIKANTRSLYDGDEARQMADIENALAELNTYADQTIYNFAQMTDNVGKFVAQGLDVYEATNAVKGMANLAGASGASAADMARATYQMSQALGGVIRKMDWNSLRNANMASVELKNVLTDLARVKGIDIDSMIQNKGIFEDTLEEGWLTGDLFTEAMNIYSDVYSEAELKAMGFKDEQIANFKSLAQTAKEATTEVKTFSQLWDVLKETAQSGWTQTWELIIGDFESAKSVLTSVQIFLSDIINGWSEARNTFLAGALKITDPWNSIVEKLEGSGLGKIKEMAESIGDVTDKVQYFQDVVTKVWRGDFGNVNTSPLIDRYTLLEAAGYDHRVVQDLVNKGYQYKITMEDIEASHKKFGLTMDKTTESTNEATQSFGELSDQKLRDAGLTETEIRLYRDLEAEAQKQDKTIGELVDEMSELDGRTMLIETLKNAGLALLDVFGMIKKAWVEAFPPPSSIGLYNLIKKIYEFSKSWKLAYRAIDEYTETGEKLFRVFRGLVAAIDIVATLTGGVFRVVFKAAQAILNAFGMDVLDLAAMLGDGIVVVRDWIDAHDPIIKLVEKIVPYLMKAVEGVKNWIGALRNGEDVPGDIIAGWIGGLWEGAKKLFGVFMDIATKVIEVVCDVLGIHSPSLVFWSIGTFIMLGLIAGLVQNGPKLWETIKEVGSKLISSFKDVDFKTGLQQATAPIWEFFKGLGKKLFEFIENIDFGKILAAGIGVGLILTIKTVADAINSITGILQGLTDGLGEMFTSIGKMFKGIGNWFNSMAIVNMAIGIAVLAYAISQLAGVDAKSLWKAYAVIFALAALMALLLTGMTFLSKIPTVENNLAKLTVSLIAVAAAILLVAVAIKIMSSVEDIGKVSEVVLGIFGLIGVALLGLALINKLAVDVSSMGKFLLGMAASILLVAVAMKVIAGIPEEDCYRALAVVSGVILLCALVSSIAKLSGEHGDKAGKMLFKMAGAMLIMVLVVKLASMMKWDDIEKGLLFAGGVGLLFTYLIAVSYVAGEHADKAGKMLSKMAFAILLMVGAIKLISLISDDELKRGLVVIAGIEAMFIALVLVTKNTKKYVTECGSMLIKMSVAMLILAGVIFLLGEIVDANPKGVWQAVGIIAALSAVFAGLIAVTKLGGKTSTFSKSSTGTIIALAVAIGVMASALIGLSFIPVEDLMAAGGALSAVIAAFGLLVFATKQIGDANPKGVWQAVGLITVMGLIVTGLALVIAKLAKCNTDSVLGTALGLSALIVAMTVSLVLLSTLKTIGQGAVDGVWILTAMVIPLAAFAFVLACMQGVDNALNNALVLTGFVAAMTLLLVPLTIIGYLGIGAIAGVGVLITMAGAMGLLALLLYDMQGIQNAQANADLLGGLVWSMSKSLLLLTVVGAFGLAAVAGVGVLIATIVAFGALAYETGKLMTMFPGIQAFINKGLPLLEQLAGGLGRMIGKFVGGMAEGMLSSLPNIGLLLSRFMKNAQYFIAGAKLVDEKVKNGVGILTSAIIKLTVADFINGIAQMSLFVGTLPELGTELSKFMKKLGTFIRYSKEIDEDTLDSVITLTEVICALTTANFLSGITSFLTFGTSWESFSEGIGVLGTGVKNFAYKTGEITDKDLESAKSAAGILVTLAEVSNEIDNFGGLSALIFGDNEIERWGEQLDDLGRGLVGFIIPLREANVTKSDVGVAEDAADIIRVLADAAKAIPNSGGLLGAIVGDNDVGSWSNQLVSLGTCMVNFVSAIRAGNLTEDDIALAEVTGKIITTIAKAAKGIPNAGGVIAEMIGDNKLSDFSIGLVSLGTCMVSFVSAIRGCEISQTDVDNAKFVSDVITILANASEEIPNAGGTIAKWIGDNEISTWAGKLPQVAEGITGFCAGLSDMSSDSVSKTKAVADIVATLAKASGGLELFSAGRLVDVSENFPEVATNINTFMQNLGGVDSSKAASAKKIVDTIVAAIKNTADVDVVSVEYFKIALADLAESGISSFVDTFSSDEVHTESTTAINGWVDSVTTTIGSKGTIAKFRGVGMQLAEGFAQGIKNGTYMAVSASLAMANACVLAAKNTLNMNSPSRVFRAIGEGVPEGFVMGINSMIGQVEDSSNGMAQSAIGTVSKSISRIAELVNSDIDTQPTIRPILDLSDVESGANTIGSMFGLNPSVGLMAKVGAIDAAMSYGQNGGNSDVVSAIDKLGSKIDNLQTNTTNINGVTYDDGSNVANTVKALVRAVRIEGRT